MTVLAFDTVTSVCAVVVWHKGVVLAKASKISRNEHAEVLVPMIEAVMAEASVRYSDLELLAVTVGPGAFTGIRIGLATARSLALASKLPLVGITNFDGLVHGISQHERKGRKILVVLETKRADFYVTLFEEDLSIIEGPKTVDAAGLCTLADNQSILVLGDAAERGIEVLKKMSHNIIKSTSGDNVDLGVVAKLAVDVVASGTPITRPSPLYLKPPNVTLLPLT